MACCHGRMMGGMMCMGAGHHHGAMMCACNKGADYGLAAPLPPTQLSGVVTLAKPRVRRTQFMVVSSQTSHGYSLPPFEPPRA